MNFQIKRNKSELDSTGYMEIGPGKYAGDHWQEGFIFVWNGDFWVAEGIIRKHFEGYDHLDMNDIPYEVGKKIISEWDDASRNIMDATPSVIKQTLLLHQTPSFDHVSEVIEAQHTISALLADLSVEVNEFYKRGEYVCILGM